MWAVYSLPSGPVKVQSNSAPTSASTPDGHVTSFGLNLVWPDTTSTTDFAAPSGLILDPQPARSSADETATTSNARRIVAVLQISGNATSADEPARELVRRRMIVGNPAKGIGHG